jgi:hypothetical protein
LRHAGVLVFALILELQKFGLDLLHVQLVRMHKVLFMLVEHLYQVAVEGLHLSFDGLERVLNTVEVVIHSLHVLLIRLSLLANLLIHAHLQILNEILKVYSRLVS